MFPLFVEWRLSNHLSRLLSLYSRVISIFVEIVMTTWNALGDYGLTVARASYVYRRNGAVSINVFTFVFQVFCLQVSFLSGFLSSEDIRSYGYLLSQRKYKSFESSLYRVLAGLIGITLLLLVPDLSSSENTRLSLARRFIVVEKFIKLLRITILWRALHKSCIK